MSTPLHAWRERLRTNWQGRGPQRFLAWWGGELRAALPPGWRAMLGESVRWHLLQRVGEEWVLRRAGHAEPLARWSDSLDADAQQSALDDAWRDVDVEDRRLALLMPPEQVLRRALRLPLAARANLHRVAGYEVDRQTPFPLAQVAYAVRELGQPAVRGLCAVELLVVRRDTRDALLGRLRELGISVDAVDTAQGNGRLGVDWLPPDAAPRRARPRLRMNLVWAAACVVLLLLAMGSWLHNRRQALAQMETAVASMRGEAQQVIGLRKQLQDDAGAAGFLARRKMQHADPLVVLLDLTRRLPHDVWLERFGVDDSGQISFQGESPQASRLPDLLKGSTSFGPANFQGSIQADPESGKERFSMATQWRPDSTTATATPRPTSERAR